MEVLVFSTNVNSWHEVENLRPSLNDLLHGRRWNFDLEDCDRILRVEAPASVSIPIREALAQWGYVCAELE